MEPYATFGREAAPLFMEWVLRAYTIICAGIDLAGIIVESDSDDTQHRSCLTPKSVVKLSPDIKCEMEHVLGDVSIVTKPDVEEIFENRLTKRNCTVQRQCHEFLGRLKF